MITTVEQLVDAHTKEVNEMSARLQCCTDEDLLKVRRVLEDLLRSRVAKHLRHGAAAYDAADKISKALGLP